MRFAEDRVDRHGAGDAAHHPADRGVAEILVGGERIGFEEVGRRAFQALVHLRLEVIVLVVAAQVDDGIDRRGIHREGDERLRLLPRAGGGIQHHPRLAVGADPVGVQLLLEIARIGRLLVAAEIGCDRAAVDHEDVAVGGLDGGKSGPNRPTLLAHEMPHGGLAWCTNAQ